MLESLFLILFPMMLMLAAFSDLLAFRIPNAISVAIALGYVAVAIFLRLPLADVALDVLCGVAVFALALTLFNFNLISGGYAKLATASAVWIGWSHLSSYALLVAFFAFVLTILVLILRTYKAPKILLSNRLIQRLADDANGAPYGIAFALGGLAVYPQTAIWSGLAGG